MISLRTETFRRYVDRALEGRTGLGRLIAGIVIVLVCWGIATFGMIFLGMAALFAISQMGGEAFDFSDAGVLMARFAATPIGLISLLLSLGGLWIGVWIALRLLHKRKVATMLSISGRFDRADFLRAFAAFTILPFLAQLASLPFEAAVVRNPIPLGNWLLAALAMVPALLIQTSAEEAFFRGYLPQNLAARFASPFVWALLPALAFSALHWRRDIPAEISLAMFGAILIFAFVLLALLSRTGSLAASMGAHFGNNLVAILFVSHDDLFAGAAFFNGQTLQDMPGGWAQAATQFVASAGMIVIGYLLLTHRRSPLALSAFRMQDG